MAKGAYIGVEGVAQKIKKGYIGVDGIARKIIKAYIGIGGVARPCWSGGELTYYGTLTPLAERWRAHSATTVGGYALYVGGTSTGNKAFVYDKSLTRIDVENLAVSRYQLAATTVGNYAVIGGGNTSYGTFESYDTSLTHQVSTFESPRKKLGLAATTVGSYAVFAGGSGGTESDRVDYCDGALTFYSAAKVLKSPRGNLAAATVGECAIFAGGGAYSKVVDIYDASVTQLDRSDYLRTARRYLSATAVGDYALFAGGRTSSTGESNEVDAFNSSLTRIDTVENLSNSRTDIMATTIDELAMFAGGRNITNNKDEGFDTVDVYDSSLVRKAEVQPLREPRGDGAATTLGSFAIFVGGLGNPASSTEAGPYTVDVYTV